MTIQTQLTEKDVIEISFILFYRKIAFKILTGIMFFGSILVIALSIAGLTKLEFSNFIAPLFFLVIMPFTIYSSAKKGYRNNHQTRELISYHIDDEKLLVEGETFNSTFPWSTINEVRQTKNWILIFQNKQRAFALSRKNLWGGEIAELKDILTANGVKNRLKDLS